MSKLLEIKNKIQNNEGKIETIKGSITGKIYYIFKPIDTSEEMTLLTFDEVYQLCEVQDEDRRDTK